MDLRAGHVGFIQADPPEALEAVTELRMERGFAFFTLHIASAQLHALFDTGAGYSVLNRRCLAEVKGQVEDLGYEAASDPTGASARVPLFRAVEACIGKRTLPPFRFLAIDLGPVEELLGVPLDFVFGVEAMAGSEWIVDGRACVLWNG
ncbi:MAG: retropepsin-like aspartic protease [Chthonomonadales bacterium]